VITSSNHIKSQASQYRIPGILVNICFALNCLLIFLLLFENRLIVPAWLQVAGRTHPLLVHFPIVLVLLYVLGSLVSLLSKAKSDSSYRAMNDLLLLLAALSSVLTALMGLFLSREEGYDPDALQLHKWGGVILSVFTLGWYYLRFSLQSIKILPYCVSVLALGIILVTGHQGAGITHGQNFLFAPMTPEKKKHMVPFEEAIVFADLVKPILEEKCMSCHNSKKAKGQLVMESEELLLKGGKNGKLWDSTATDFGLLLQRVHLPLEQKKHMPPHGKPQLTEQELEIIAQWIRKGASFTLKAADLPAEDTLRLIAAKTLMDSETAQYDFEAADPDVIQRLNTSNRAVAQESLNSPALNVSFFNAKLFDAQQLKELGEIKKQIVTLDLSKMPVKDADIKMIGEFENLRRLYLNFTDITGSSLSELQKLKFLKTLSLSGTQVNTRELAQLKSFPQLKTVYVWNIPADTAALKQIQANAKTIRFETGFRGDTITLKLSPPIFQNDEQIISNAVSLKLKHYLPGVTIRYTTDSTEPDSVHSLLYQPGKMISMTTLVRAKAYKPGWISSDITETLFYKHGYIADTAILLTPTDSSYSGNSKFLTDLEKGTTEFRAGNWLGWRRNKMQVLLEYDQPIVAQSVMLSTVIDVYRYIMPPLRVEVWGGENQHDLKLLGSIVPKQPTSMKPDSLQKAPAYLKGYECKFKPATVKYIKVIGTTVSKLPKWHTGKGDMGYIFVDEIVVN
jgi:uncharacterized membrane protein